MKSKKIKTISFKDVAKLDGNYTVMPALLVTEEDYDETIKDMNDFFVKKHKMVTGKITSLKRITGNVLGDEGRADYLMSYSRGSKISSTLILVSAGTILWVPDFVKIYSKDFEK